MEKIPTAEEYLASKQYDWVEDINTTECMIEFAKLHVQQALKEASEKVVEIEGTITDSKLTDAILTSYPIENIK